MSNWTTESWSPIDCICVINHMFLEGLDAPQVNGSNMNLALYCSLDRATEIRKNKHDARVTFFTDTQNEDKLKKENIWWKKRKGRPYKEYKCPSHINLTDHIWYRTLADESQRRQISYNIMTNLQPEKFTEVVIPFEWIGDGQDRLLYLLLAPEDLETMPDLRTMLDIQFGPAKVAPKEIQPFNEKILQDLLSL